MTRLLTYQEVARVLRARGLPSSPAAVKRLVASGKLANVGGKTKSARIESTDLARHLGLAVSEVEQAATTEARDA